MRTALIYNFLLESTIIASIAILLMLILRKCLGKQLGRKALLFAWILIAIRLLCPLALPNPLINEIRSPFAPDPAIRPIAGQIKVRLEDAVSDLSFRAGYGTALGQIFLEISSGLFNGSFARSLMKVYLFGAALSALCQVLHTRRKQKPFALPRILSIICCTVHWFNPLVWLAAHMFERDRKQESPGSRALAIAFMAVSSLLLVCTFGTAEYIPKLLPESSIPTHVTISPLPEHPTDDQVIERSISICGNEYFLTDMRKAEWTVERRASGYKVVGKQGDVVCTLHYLPDGRLASYHCDDAISGSTIQRTQPEDGFGDLLATYCLSLLDSALPGLSDTVEAFDDPLLFHEGDRIYAYQSGLTMIDGRNQSGVYVSVDLANKPKVRTFRLESVLLRHLWSEGMEPLQFHYAEQLGGFAVNHSLTERENSPYKLEAPEGCISAEKAIELVKAYLKTNFHETDASLLRFEVRYGFIAEGLPHRWVFFLDSGFLGNATVDQYEIHLDAQTGEILDCWGPEDGNG